MQDPWVAGKMFGGFPSNFFTQPFQYFQIVNLVDCLSSWYIFIMKQAHGGEFANFVVTPNIERGCKHRCLRYENSEVNHQSMFSPPLLNWISVSKVWFLQLRIFQNILNWMNKFSNISTLIWIFISFLFGIYIFLLLFSPETWNIQCRFCDEK